MNRTQLVQLLAERTDIPKAKANLLLETLYEVATENLKQHGEFAIPNFVKLVLKDKPATKERQGMNPFTKTPVTIPAKPASKKVSARPVGDLKKAFA
jgi:DNA-binding protein HU-beta